MIIWTLPVFHIFFADRKFPTNKQPLLQQTQRIQEQLSYTPSIIFFAWWCSCARFKIVYKVMPSFSPTKYNSRERSQLDTEGLICKWDFFSRTSKNTNIYVDAMHNSYLFFCYMNNVKKRKMISRMMIREKGRKDMVTIDRVCMCVTSCLSAMTDPILFSSGTWVAAFSAMSIFFLF